MSQPITYRPEIDGLRALAVLAVFAYHLNHDWLPGGYLGVDVFFVISGFLITAIMMKSCEAGDFGFGAFYLRRARRILPAVLAVTALSLVAAFFILFPDEHRAAVRACKKALLCCSNYHFAKGDGYFDPDSESNPFLHTWSLGVEEQFYFVFPLLVVTAYRWRLLKARWLGVFVAIGLALSIVLTRLHPTHAFFALESRAWELGAGAWLAVAAARGTTVRVLAAAWGPWVALGLLCGGLVFLGRGDLTPAPLAVPVILGAVLFIGSRAGGEGAFWHRVFASRPLRYVGRISYSLYLIHWPVIVFAQARYGELSGLGVAAVVLVSFALAALSQRLIEEPFRQGRHHRVFLAVTGVSVALLLGWAGYVNRAKGEVNSAMTAALRDILPESQQEPDMRRGPYRIGDTSHEPTLGLWGDSHAMMLVPALEQTLRRRGVCCEVWTQPGNLPALGVSLRGQQRVINNDAVTALARPGIRGVIIAARWSSYNRGKPEDHDPATRIVGAPTPDAATAAMRRGLESALDRIAVGGRRVVLMYPLPEAGVHVPYLLARRLRAGSPIDGVNLTEPAREYAMRHDLTLPLLDDLCRKYGLIPSHPERMLIRDGALTLTRDGLSLYLDDDHLSRFGSEPLVTGMLEQLGVAP